MKKVLITGGHLTPALAVLEELQSKKWSVAYVGRKYALEGDTSFSAEYQVIHQKDISFHNITTGRLQRSFTRFTLLSLLKIPIGFLQSTFILLQERPSLVMSFGGYIAVPIVIVAWLCGIPIITHEQTIKPGLANRIIAWFADVICVSWKESASHFPAAKTVVTGNP